MRPCAPISQLQQWRASAGALESVGETLRHNGAPRCLTAGPAAAAPNATITLSVDVTARGQRLNHVWKAAVGSSHASMTLRTDWQDHLRNASRAIGFVRPLFHFHHFIVKLAENHTQSTKSRIKATFCSDILERDLKTDHGMHAGGRAIPRHLHGRYELRQE